MANDGLDLTRAIKKLSMPASTNVDELQEVGGTALLFSSNADATKWAPRWLKHYNVRTIVVEDATNALNRVRSSQPDALIDKLEQARNRLRFRFGRWPFTQIDRQLFHHYTVELYDIEQ